MAPNRIIEHETFICLVRAREFIAEHFASGVPLERAALEACFSPFHFQRLYKRAFQESPQEFLTRMRMDAAKKMLRDQRSVTDVCFEVGYESLGTFSSRFSQHEGCAPSEFRRIFALPGLWALRSTPTCFRRFFA